MRILFVVLLLLMIAYLSMQVIPVVVVILTVMVATLPGWLCGVILLAASWVLVLLVRPLMGVFKDFQRKLNWKNNAQHLIGLLGEVSRPISNGGFGQVKLIDQGVERILAAKCASDQEIESNQVVRIKDVAYPSAGEPILLIVEVLIKDQQEEK